ncbi:MAG: Stealth CR1 domain-containing protein [Muribaculaceae bacterium]|nr:Stealth CR1 domain-containing protein [Muribaculaceae bacterium]
MNSKEHIRQTPGQEVDLVYLWVDGNDPEWRAKHDALTGVTRPDDSKGRYADNEELRYSLRSVEQYAPWVRHIYIVTDNQVPEWLNTDNPRIRIVDHTEILPRQSIPCFNSNVIEHCLHRIPGLAERFLYANDDMLFSREVTPDDFFAPDGLPLIRMTRSPLRRVSVWFRDKMMKRPLSMYNMALRNSSRLVHDKFGVYFSEKTHHNVDAYLKSDFVHVAEMFREEIAATMDNHLRRGNDIQRIIYSYVPLAENRGHKLYVTRSTSFILRIHKPKYYERIKVCNPMFFCCNDSQYATDDDRRKATEYLKSRFPRKSEFEKP